MPLALQHKQIRLHYTIIDYRLNPLYIVYMTVSILSTKKKKSLTQKTKKNGE